MIRHKPWHFFIFKFNADDGKHKVSVGTADREAAIELIMDMYSNVRNLRIIPKPRA